MKVIADVVFNHVSSMDEYKGLDKFPGLAPADFHGQCGIDYSKRDSVLNCWLGGDLPDLDQSRPGVQDVQKAHIRKLLSLGIDGFRFDAAKHIDAALVKDYIDLIDRESNGRTWNYLEVIEDDGTQATDYNSIAAVTDFVLYKESLRKAFGFGGDLRSSSAEITTPCRRITRTASSAATTAGRTPILRRHTSWLANRESR